MMKKLLFLFLSVIFIAKAQAQILTIKDQESKQTLELVTISSENASVFVISNAKGQADIELFKASTKIEIRLVGYQTLTKSYADLENDKFEIFLTPSGVSLDQVVVSASRWQQSKNQIPNKITSISKQQIALQNPQTAADLLGVSGEVFIQKSQMGGGSPMIRGFSTNRLLIAVDGIRMNTAIFRSGNLQNVISLDPFATENTEVLFGAGSVIYGSDAIGGVMSFQTLSPQLALQTKTFVKGKAITRYSSANQERTGHFDINIGWKKWALLSSFSTYQFDDLRMGSRGKDEYLNTFYVQRQNGIDVVIQNDNQLLQRPTGYSQINVMQKIRFKPTDYLDFQYGFLYSATSDYGRYDRLIRMRSDGTPRSAEWNYGPQIWQMNHLSINYDKVNRFFDQMTIRLAHQFFEESRIDRDFNDEIRRSRIEKVNALSANFDFSKNINDKHSLYYGLEFVRNKVESISKDEDISTKIQISGPARYPQSNWFSQAVYLTYQYNPNDKFSLQTGLRYNLFQLNGTFDTSFYPFPFTDFNIQNGAITGSFGLTFKPSKTTTIRINLATGFRSPNIDDVGKVFDSTPGSVIVPNPQLNAEYAYNAEIGIAQKISENITLELTTYYTLLDNAMVRRNFTLNGLDSIVYAGELSQVEAIQNAAKTSVYGFQMGINVKLPWGFGFASRLSFQKGEEELDNGEKSPARHVAPIFGITRLTYTKANLSLDFNVQYNGEISYANLSEEGKGTSYLFAKDSEGNPYAPSWLTLNFKALYQIKKYLSCSTGIENITDQRYRPYSSGISAAGRNFIISLIGTF